MVAYRLYCLDGAGRISLPEWIDAHDDVDAAQQARKLKQGSLKCEVWQERRLVAELDMNDLADGLGQARSAHSQPQRVGQTGINPE